MNIIIKRKWLVMITWIVLLACLVMAAPNISQLVRDKGQVNVPKGYSSHLAAEIMNNVQKQKDGGQETQVALVFHDNKKLTEPENLEAKKAVQELEDHKQQLGITEILSHFNDKSLSNQLVSKDGKSILVSVSVAWNNREPTKVSEELYKTIENVKVDHYYTSNWMISEDLMKSSEEGLKKTEGITVVFILGVLLLVFRSLISPVIPLVTVGLAYLAAQSIVAILVDKLNFPISSYTQIFLVCVLFGIGTDYCILLLSRFKEELSQNDSLAEAIVKTYRTAGRTVFFSGIAVMIGFATIGFSQFILYQSASAVAIGVAMLLIALFTIVPFFMAVLGRKLFWPSKGKLEHAESRIWGAVGKFSLARPLLSLLIVAAICVPFLVTYDGKLSFNSLEEISGKVPSIRAFNAIAGSFGPGESMPTQIVIKNDEAMNSSDYIDLAEKISQEVEKVNMVKTVRSVTRPTGKKVNEFYVNKQAESLGEGLGKGNEGITKISNGLSMAGSKLAKSEPQLGGAVTGINGLINGTNQLKSGVAEVQTNLAKIEDGIRQGSAGSAELKKGLEKTKAGAENLLAGYKKLQTGYKDLDTNLGTLNSKYKDIGDGLKAISSALSQINGADFSYLESHYNGLAKEAQYQKIKGTVLSLQQQTPSLSAGMNQLNSGLSQIISGMDRANDGFNKANEGQQSLSAGLEKLIKGIDQQQSGLNQLADGQGQIVSNMPKLTSGLSGINDGQKQLLAGFGGLTGQLKELTSGLNKSSKGLDQVSSGLDSAKSYLNGLSDSDNLSGFHLPKEVLTSKDFAKAIEAYMSKDHKVMTIDVVLTVNPYSNQALNQVSEIKAAVKRATKNTKLENAVVAVGGITSINADLNKMSNQDFSRTVVLMLLGIGLILVFLFRSIIMPIYLIASLILTYFTSMAMNEAIFVNVLGYTGISWAVPFFGFVILVALGVDYSIFLMDRFNEYKDLSVPEAMLISMKKMGTVIISAAVILGGTFAAMMPSGMLSLLQIASIVLIGLLLYAFVILPLFIPVMVKNFGKANWWPFTRTTN